MSSATDNLTAAFERAANIRPKTNGFPTLAKVLQEAGVQSNEWFLPSCESVFWTDLGPVVQQGAPLADGLLDVPVFDRDALIAALRADQAGETTLPEFLMGAWKAGVYRYVVDMNGRTVTYFGADGETYTEPYPDVEI